MSTPTNKKREVEKNVSANREVKAEGKKRVVKNVPEVVAKKKPAEKKTVKKGAGKSVQVEEVKASSVKVKKKVKRDEVTVKKGTEKPVAVKKSRMKNEVAKKKQLVTEINGAGARGASAKGPTQGVEPTPSENQPRFTRGAIARLIQYTPPLPRGSKVAVVDVNETKGGFKYLIEGQFKGESVRLWMKEKELDLPYID